MTDLYDKFLSFWKSNMDDLGNEEGEETLSAEILRE